MKQIDVCNLGWRKPTRELCIAAQFADEGEAIEVSKTEAMVAIKRVAAKIGLRPADLILLDLLCALSQPQDWEKGARPIVWPSNHFLAEQLGMSERAIQRHAKKLGDLGLISFKDNSNGHRRGRRDANGHIIEAYGFDLSPLKARAGEFELLHEEITAERQFKKLMRKHITVSRRSIRSMVQMAYEKNLNGDWAEFDAALDQLIEKLPNHSAPSEFLAEIAQNFLTLQEHVKNAYESAQSIDGIASAQIEHIQNSAQLNPELAPSNDQTGSHILVTNYKTNSVNSKLKQDEILEQQAKNYDAATKPAYDKRKAERVEDKTSIKPNENRVNEKVTPKMVNRSCPEFIAYARAMGILDEGQITRWHDLVKAAHAIHPTLGISQLDYSKAIDIIGENTSAIALALIFEKYNFQEISSPAGYLHALTCRAQIGELHLAKSIYGRLMNE